jgi:hypothetical protein
MVDEIAVAFDETLRMFEDGVQKIPDDRWRQGSGDFLIPVRISYHIIVGLEWFVTALPEDEHRNKRRYNLNWKGTVDGMPDRHLMLEDLAWMHKRIVEWFADWKRELVEGADSTFRLKKALYFLRHTQHHIGEFCATARLLDLERPAWIYPQFTPRSIIENA